MASKINIEQYIYEIKRKMNLEVDDDILKKDLFTDFGFFLLILKNGKKEWVLFTEGLNNDRFHFFPKT